MRIVPINCITEETTLAKTIYNDKGNILLRSGTKLTTSLLEKIKAADINTIYIDDGYSDEEIHDVVKPELRAKAVKTIKETFQSIEHDIKKNLEISTDFNKRLKHRVMDKYLEKFKSVADAIIEDILKSHHLMVNIIDIKHIGEYQYEHAVNVAILSLVIGMEMRLSRHEMFTLFVGAILHDIGKVFISQDVLEAGDNRTKEQQEIYETHALEGYEYLKDNKGFAATAKIIIAQHHEHYDGTGYPYGTHDEAIHRNARIVAICNTYDRMTSDGPNSPALPPNEAIEYIMGCAGTKFDFDIVHIFCRKVNPYPVGTLVDLSNKKTGVVVDTNMDLPMRPIIQILAVEEKQVIKKEIIDLLSVTDITISKIRYHDLIK